MTQREPKPYTATHNLAKPPKLAPPLQAGDDVEALHGGTHKGRQARYRRAIRILQALIADDHLLELRVREAAKAPFPAGGVSGSRHSGVSDPTYKAATRTSVKDPAERAWASADQAMKALWWADTHRTRALRMTAADGVLAEMDDEEQLEYDDGCTNHAKIGEYIKRGAPPSVPTDSTLCVWCHQTEREYGTAPPRELLRLKRERGRLFKRDYEAAGLRASQPTKPGS